MILECPECRTRYLVADEAIGAGRTVRCATCRHSWYQPGEMAFVAPAATVPTPPPVATPEPAYRDAATEAPTRYRRNPAKRWTAMAVAAGLVMLLCVAAILYSGAPGLAAQLGLGIAPAETPLRLVDNPITRRPLPNGSEIFAVSGRVVNPTTVRQHVPDVRAELRDAQGRLVYSWTIRPETMELAPRTSVEFNSAKLDVPANAHQLVLSFAGNDPA